jgi:AraC-like DNA-binding protein
MGETVEWGAPSDLPGLVTLRVREGVTLWRWFHETYTFCTALCIPGCGSEWTYRGRMHQAAHDATMLLEPGETHCTHRQWGAVDFDVYLFDPAVVGEAAEELGLGGWPHFRSASVREPRIHRAFRRLMQSVTRPSTALERQCRVADVLARLLSEQGERCPETSVGRSEHRAVGRTKALLHDRMADNLTLGELARATGLSRYHLARVFKRATGVSLHEYQLLVRIQEATRKLMRGERPVDVAAELGFADQSHFGRHFRRIVHVSPAAFARATSGATSASSSGT